MRKIHDSESMLHTFSLMNRENMPNCQGMNIVPWKRRFRSTHEYNESAKAGIRDMRNADFELE